MSNLEALRRAAALAEELEQVLLFECQTDKNTRHAAEVLAERLRWQLEAAELTARARWDERFAWYQPSGARAA